MGVIAQHGLPPAVLYDSFSAFHAGMAVPVFVIISALNLAGSVGRSARGDGSWRLSEYLRRRLGRLVPPLLITAAVALVIGIASRHVYFGALTALGALPYPGPGGYFIPLVFETVLVFPLLYAAYRRSPKLTVIALLVLDAAFELICNTVGPIKDALAGDTGRYVYDAALPRYFGALALGLWMASDARLSVRRNRWIIAAAAVSVAYLIFEHVNAASFGLLVGGFERRTNVLAVGLAALIVMLGLRFLPGDVSRSRLGGLAADVGKASYHIFLVQILWFGRIDDRTPALLPVHAAACIAIGLLFWRLESRARPRLSIPLSGGRARVGQTAER